MHTLTTDRLILRPPASKDADAAVAFYMSERSQYAGGHVPRFRAFSNFAAMLGHWEIRGFGLWAVTLQGDDQAIGMVGPYYPEGWPETELGWVLFEGHEGHGYAVEAALAARKHAYDVLGWTSIVSYIARQNTQSVAVAERLGAKLDPDAITPKPEDPCFVYRHPGPDV